MPRLVTFGCSLTYGHGLEDCFEPPQMPGPKHSNLAWPTIVANKFNLKLENRSEPGLSNRGILHKILEFRYRKNDVIVVMWTNVFRWSKITPFEIENYGLWLDTPYVNMLAENADEHDLTVTSAQCANLAWHHLKQKIYTRQFHIISGSGIKYNSPWRMTSFEWNKVKFEDYDFSLRQDYPLALDNAHPGPEAHKQFAKLVVKSIDKV